MSGGWFVRSGLYSLLRVLLFLLGIALVMFTLVGPPHLGPWWTTGLVVAAALFVFQPPVLYLARLVYPADSGP